jgi:hypothetical protein
MFHSGTLSIKSRGREEVKKKVKKNTIPEVKQWNTFLLH